MDKLIVLVFILLSGFANAGKMHTLEVEVREGEHQALLPGIKLMIRVDYGEEKVIYTNAEGRYTLTWEGKLKSISINAYDTSGVYRYAHVFIGKEELKADLIKRVLYMQSRPNYDVLFADFRKIDAAKRQENIAKGIDTTVYTGEDCPDLLEGAYKNTVADMQQWIVNNIRYPQEAIERNEQGRVYMNFIIEQDGSISHVNIDRGVSDALDFESVRLLYSMPKWNPATCNGVPVRSLARMPISYTLN